MSDTEAALWRAFDASEGNDLVPLCLLLDLYQDRGDNKEKMLRMVIGNFSWSAQEHGAYWMYIKDFFGISFTLCGEKPSECLIRLFNLHSSFEKAFGGQPLPNFTVIA